MLVVQEKPYLTELLYWYENWMVRLGQRETNYEKRFKNITVILTSPKVERIFPAQLENIISILNILIKLHFSSSASCILLEALKKY